MTLGSQLKVCLTEAIEEFDDDLEYGSITRLAEEMEGAKKVTI